MERFAFAGDSTADRSGARSTHITSTSRKSRQINSRNIVTHETFKLTQSHAFQAKNHASCHDATIMLRSAFPAHLPPTVAKMTQCHTDSFDSSENCHQGLVRISISVFVYAQSVHLDF
ncbi:hypothetical protein [Sphingopyxis sp. YF1]|jgi:hypothetical protein|uniref:hypothetical protein n=1 Tax=Sphingopyxis sp. YF1 TaxID=2482763 RepID=UPI001F61D5C8|nr:hypothetical protein [Sphingopyxis sp. YF1]